MDLLEQAVLGKSSAPDDLESAILGNQASQDPLEQAVTQGKKTWLNAAGTTLAESTKEMTGGLMEFAGAKHEVPTDTAAVAQDIVQPGLNGPGGLPQAVVAGTRMLGQKIGDLVRGGPVEQTQFEKDLEGAGRELSESARQKMKAANPEDMGMVGEAGLSVVQSLPPVLTGLAARRLGASDQNVMTGVLSSFGAQSFGQTYAEAKKALMEKGDPYAAENAMRAALRNAGYEVGTEMLPMDALLKGGTGWFKKFLLREVGSEELATISQSLDEKKSFNANKWSSAGEIGHDLAVTALAAAGTGGVVGSVERGLQYADKKFRQEKHDETEASTAELADAFRQIQEQQAELSGTVIPDYSPQPSPPPAELTVEQQAEANAQKKVMDSELQLPDNPLADEISAELRGAQEERLASGEFEDASEDEGGMSAEVLGRRALDNTQAENTPHDLRQIVAASDNSVVGLNLRQAPPSAGMVVATTGNQEENYPLPYVQAVTETVKKWIDKYAPNARVILNFDSFAPESGAFGLHQTVHFGDQLVHVITPRELPSLKYKGGNVKTQMDAAFGLAHEFGHLLKSEIFYSGLKEAGLDAAAMRTVRKSIENASITEAEIQQLEAVAPTEGKLVRDWATLRAAILDGTMTAQQFMEHWVGLRKLASPIAKQKAENIDSMEWARQMLGQQGKTLEGSSALDLVNAAYQGGIKNLSFDEFMAEQYSRYAYTNTQFGDKGLGALFKNALAKLRQMFVEMKRDGAVAPRETFQQWLDEQTKRFEGKRRYKKHKLAKNVAEAKQKAIEAELAKLGGVAAVDPNAKPAPAPTIAEEIQSAAAEVEAASPPEHEELAAVDEKQQLLDLVNKAEEHGNGTKRMAEIQAKALRNLIERGDLLTAEQRLEKFFGDSLHWDLQSQIQTQVKDVADFMHKMGDKTWQSMGNLFARGFDGLIQLQQRAAVDVWDKPLQSFVSILGRAEQFKNKLQFQGEEVTKRLLKLGKKDLASLQAALEAEWKSGGHASELVGLDADDNVVWDSNNKARRSEVVRWAHQDSLAFRQLLQNHGIDVTTANGEALLKLALAYKNAILVQYGGLEAALQEAADNKYHAAPLVLQQELLRVEQTMHKLRTTPLVPQGRYGKYVLLVQKRSFDPKRKQNRWQNVRVQHFESQSAWQKARETWAAGTRGDRNMRVHSKVLEEFNGVPMQLPQDFLDNVANTGLFAQEQIDVLQELMMPARYEKLEARYEKIADQMAGADEDLIRNFADFIWHNANFTWKMHFRRELNRAQSWKRREIRLAERTKSADPVAQRKQVDTMRRNQAIMQRVQAYVLYPPAEHQSLRLVATMFYLAYNIKTAVLNFSTMAHTWFAAGSEYGEIEGAAAFGRALKETASLPWIDQRLAAVSKANNQQEFKRLQIIKNVYGRALVDGIIDQSYAYFLAGQANGLDTLRKYRRTKLGQFSHAALDFGMLPFRSVEKANRIASLLTFVELEMKHRTAAGVPFGDALKQSYDVAVQKTNLLQNAYDQANKAEIFRGTQGKTSVRPLFTMFMSYVQFMGWMTTGGYERAVRAQIREANAEPGAVQRKIPNAMTGVTAKLWLMYLLMGGLWGIPFAQNLKDLVQFAWRKLAGKNENIEIEIRKMVKELGADPDMVLHGAMYDVGGFNLSGSFGLGRMVPGTDLLNKHFDKPADMVGKGMLTAAGAFGGFAEDLMKVAGSVLSGDRLSKTLGELPGAVGSVSKTIDAMMLQANKPGYGVVLNNGESLVVGEDGKPRDLTVKELIGMTLGAQTTVVSKNREQSFAEKSEVMFWQTRRQDLLKQRKDAYLRRDEQELADANKAIDRYNQDIPDRKLAITGKDKAASLKAARSNLRNSEHFGTTQKRYRNIVVEVDEGF